MPNRPNLEHRHPEFKRGIARWKFVKAHYDDRDLYDPTNDEGELRVRKVFLAKREQGESDEEYEERRKLAHYTNFTGPIMDSLTGLLFNKEDEAEREWGGLGDPEAEGSTASLLVSDVDNDATDLEAQNKQIATDLTLYKRIAVLVDTTKRPETEGDSELSQTEARELGVRPFRKIIEPQALLNWRHGDNGRLAEALILEQQDTREGLDDAPENAEQDVFLHLYRSGWTRYVDDDDSEEGMRVLDEGEFEKPYKDREGKETIPLATGRLPLRRHPAFAIARLNNAILNHENGSIVWPIRKAGFAKFIFSGEGFDEFEEKLRRGGVSLVHEDMGADASGKGHRFASPDVSGAQAALEVKQELVRDVWRTAQYEFSDQTAEQTATEIEQDFVSSIGAYLVVLAGALDEVENQSLHFLEQAAGEEPGEASVQRTRSFTVEDAQAAAERIKKILFGEMAELPIPAAVSGKVTVKILELLNLISEDELEEIEAEVTAEAQVQDSRRRMMEEARIRGDGGPPSQGDGNTSPEGAE